MLNLCQVALSNDKMPRLKKLVIAFTDFGSSDEDDIMATGTFINKFCQLLSMNRSLETLDLRCCNLHLDDMRLISQSIIGQENKSRLREINAGLNHFDRE